MGGNIRLGQSKCKHQFAYNAHPASLRAFCEAGGRHLLQSRQSNAPPIYISSCLPRCEPAGTRAPLFSPCLADFPAPSVDRGEPTTAPVEGEPCSVGNTVQHSNYEENGQQSSPDINLQSPHCVTSRFIFRESVGTALLCGKLCVRGIGAGLAAGI